jgi:colanic acid/amylovoran biosynthesis glycosyltransferase
MRFTVNNDIPARLMTCAPPVRSCGSVALQQRIVICQSAANRYSETFMQLQSQRLPGKVSVVYQDQGGLMVDGRLVAGRSWPARVAGRLFRFGSGINRQTTEYVRAFQQVGADVVIAQYGTVGVRVITACQIAGVPLVVYFRGFDASRRSVIDKHAEAYQRLFRQAARTIAVSEDLRQRLIAIGAPRENVMVIPSGVDTETFCGGAPAACPPLFLAVGRFVEKKGPGLTIRAFAEVHRQHPESRLRMIGDGGLLASCRELAESLGVADAVSFLGPQPHRVIAEEMREARAFVQHSVVASGGDCEGTPNAHKEASATGLPVVSTRHAGIPEVVVDNETGLLVEEHDVTGMAAQMCRLIDNPDLATRLGQAGRERMKDLFSIHRTTEKLHRVVQEVVAERDK